MAKLKKGIIDIDKGSLGGLIIYNMYGNKFVRTKPENYRDAKSRLQLINRQKLMVTQEFINPFKNIIRKTFALESGRSAYDAAVSCIRKKAVDGEYPEHFINKSKALLSRGKIALPQNVQLSFHDNGIVISWAPHYKENAHPKDTLIIIYKAIDLHFADYRYTGAQRQDNSYLFKDLNLDKHHYDIWIAFR